MHTEPTYIVYRQTHLHITHHAQKCACGGICVSGSIHRPSLPLQSNAPRLHCDMSYCLVLHLWLTAQWLVQLVEGFRLFFISCITFVLYFFAVWLHWLKCQFILCCHGGHKCISFFLAPSSYPHLIHHYISFYPSCLIFLSFQTPEPAVR